MAPAAEPSENTPLQGEHLPGAGGAALTRAQIFAPLAAALLLVGAVYGWSLAAPHTIAGLRAGGQPIGDVPYAALDGALGKVADGYLDGQIVLAFGKDERVATRRELGFVVDRAAAKAADRGRRQERQPICRRGRAGARAPRPARRRAARSMSIAKRRSSF